MEETRVIETYPQCQVRLKITPKVLEFRAKKLKITPAELQKCKTLVEIKALAKQKYRILAREHHPDHRKIGVWNGFGRCEKRGSAFRLLTNTYKWFMALTEQDIVRKSMYPTVPDLPLPWHMERAPLHLPSGYSESFDHLAYQ